MEDLKLSPQQMPIQSPERPTVVTVFGILNIIFAVLGLLLSPVSILGIIKSGDSITNSGYKMFLLLMNFIGFGFSIWLFVMGIGLLMLHNWARLGSIIYACVGILLTVIETGVNIFAMKLDWVIVPEAQRAEFIGSMCVGLVGGLVYPLLLLIFMQTTKIKQAFVQIAQK